MSAAQELGLLVEGREHLKWLGLGLAFCPLCRAAKPAKQQTLLFIKKHEKQEEKGEHERYTTYH